MTESVDDGLQHGSGESGLQAEVTALFERFRLPVYRYLVVVLGRTGEAEELTQETFIRLYDHLRAGQTADETRFWLFRVSHNLAMNALRRRRFSAPMEPDVWSDLSQQTASAPDPERRLIDREQRRRVTNALSDLSPQQRQCLALRAEGLRYREIAGLLGISYAAVVDSLRRAVAKLARAAHE